MRGDPLSPILFNIIADLLAVFITFFFSNTHECAYHFIKKKGKYFPSVYNVCYTAIADHLRQHPPIYRATTHPLPTLLVLQKLHLDPLLEALLVSISCPRYRTAA
jgi:hypothetical protein